MGTNNGSDFEYVLGLEKIETDSEDALIIAGIATSEMIDHDSEIVDMTSVKEVWKDYLVNPVIRFLHGKDQTMLSAIGKVIPEYTDTSGKTWKTEITEKGPFIVAKISNAPDTESIRKKISEGIYRGLSIGGRAKRVREYSHELGKDINRVLTQRISEISVVDLPANQDSFFNVLKIACVGDQCKIKSEEMDDKEIKTKEVKDVKKAEGGKIPKPWWDNCISTAKGVKGIDDPDAFCGWMYAHGKERGFGVQREAIGKMSDEIDSDLIKSANDLMLVEDEIEKIATDNDDLRKQIDELQSSTESNRESEEVVMKNKNTDNTIGGNNMDTVEENIVRFEPEELKTFIKSTMNEHAEETAILEKADDYDRLLAEMKDLRAKIEGLEATVTAQAKKLQNQPEKTMKNEGEDTEDTEKSESDGDVDKMELLDARLKTVEESPLYKATQDGEDMDEKDKKKTKKGHIANIVSEAFGTGGK